MKTIKIIATLLMLFAFTANVNAQFLTKEQEKAVKKDVKRYEKEGWKVKPGSPSIAMQLTKSYQMAWEKTGEGTDQWIMGGEAESIAQTIVNSMGKSVDQSIGRPSSLIEMYRDLPNGNVEVLMRLAISSAKLDALAKEAVDKARKEYLQKRVKEVKDKME